MRARPGGRRPAAYGFGLTDLVWTATRRPDRFQRAAAPRAASGGRRVREQDRRGVLRPRGGERLPRGYGPLSWTVVGLPAFVLPGPSGANNAMPVPYRAALWRDLHDFLESL